MLSNVLQPYFFDHEIHSLLPLKRYSIEKGYSGNLQLFTIRVLQTRSEDEIVVLMFCM